MTVALTGGAGYIGALAVDELLDGGHDVRVLDCLLHGQDDIAEDLRRRGVELIRGDIRDPAARRRALAGAETVVHLAAIVGDPACARDEALSHDVNVEGSRAVARDALAAGVGRFIFASTCSNYGRMAEPTVPIDERGELRPVSLYAEQKVSIERELLGMEAAEFAPTCLRFATVYGVGPRMRFDLTVNEFTRDLWSGRPLEVFGELFWRPYIHVRDAARAIRAVAEAPVKSVSGQVFNAGHSDENYRKLDLVELMRTALGRGDVRFVKREEDPRDYKVSFEKIRAELGYEPGRRVPDGIEEIVSALEEGRFGDPFDPRFSNV